MTRRLALESPILDDQDDGDDLADRLRALERHVEFLERENSGMSRVMRDIVEGRDPQALATEREHDITWSCTKCGNRLGVFDEESDVLRTRNREVYIWVHVGEGGWLKITCRHCSELNEVHYVPSEPTEG